MRQVDVVVLGAGTAGTAAARAASSTGARVVVFNEGELGGLCILRGCMPTKTLLHAAHRAHDARAAETPGVKTALVGIDFDAVMRNKAEKVARFQRAKVAGIESGDYELVRENARFLDQRSVRTASGETYAFERGAVIATGSVPHVPPLAGLGSVPYLTSDEVMALTEQPKSVVVVGSGAIGLELAQFFSRIGTHVSLVSRRRMLTDIDPLIADEMEAALLAEPDFELYQPCPMRSVRCASGGVALELEDGRSIEAQALVLATGRRANVADLDLERAGIESTNGRLAVGDDMRTTNERVFVAGDASGDRLLLHVATDEGRVAGLNAARPDASAVEVDRRLSMEVIFSDPAVASVGQTEAQACAAGLDVVCASELFAETGRAITMDVAHGAWKLVAERASGEILGSQILGPRADDLVHILSTAMAYRGTTADLVGLPWYHPTLSEVLLSLARSIEAQR